MSHADPTGVFLDTQPSGYLRLTQVARVQHLTVQHFLVGQPRVGLVPAAVKDYKAPVLQGSDATHAHLKLACTAVPHVIDAWQFRNAVAGLVHWDPIHVTADELHDGT